MKNYCKIIFMCMQVGVLFGGDLQPTKQVNRRSPGRPPEKTQTTSERTAPIPMNRSGELLRIQPEAKSPSKPITPGDYINLFGNQSCSPSPRDYYQSNK